MKITEFADIECGHCKKAYIEMKSLLKKYPDDIYFEYRHYPLPFNKYSRSFARASLCAGEQEKVLGVSRVVVFKSRKLGQCKPC